jgi:hypothetical protein
MNTSGRLAAGCPAARGLPRRPGCGPWRGTPISPAGQAWRTAPVADADFYIGAHARDAAHCREYFPTVRLIAP